MVGWQFVFATRSRCVPQVSLFLKTASVERRPIGLKETTDYISISSLDATPLSQVSHPGSVATKEPIDSILVEKGHHPSFAQLPRGFFAAAQSDSIKKRNDHFARRHRYRSILPLKLSRIK